MSIREYKEKSVSNPSLSANESLEISTISRFFILQICHGFVTPSVIESMVLAMPLEDCEGVFIM